MPKSVRDNTYDDIATGSRPFVIGGFDVDPAALRITSPDGDEVKVESKVMQVLLELVRRAGQVVSRGDLEAEVWSGRLVSEDALTNAIAKLRKAFKDSARSPRIIETVPKHGYRLLVQPQAIRPTGGAPLSAHWRLVLSAVFTVIAIAVVTALLVVGSGDETAPDSQTQPVTVAVLPFAATSKDVDGVLADGIARDLIEHLSVQPNVQVIAAKSTFALNATNPDRSLLEKLGTRYVLSGTVAKAGDIFQIEAHLTESVSGTRLLSDRVEGPESHLLDLQHDIAEKVMSVLGGKGNSDRQFVDRRGTTSTLAAYDEFLLGRALYLRMTPNDNLNARRHYSRAVELDPQFARAHAGVALTWCREVMDGWTNDTETALAEASRHVMLAEALDSDVPQIYFVKGLLELFRGEHLAAADAAHRATDLDPNYADAYALLAWTLHYGGRPDIAVKALHEALRLNPFSSASYDVIAGEINFAVSRYDQAILSFRSALARNPSHSRGRLWLAASLAKVGEYEDAAWEIEELRANNPDLQISELAFGFPHKDPELTRRFYASLQQIDRLGLLSD